MPTRSMHHPKEKRMHVVITGANSYIGAALTHFLIEHPHLDGQLITRLTRTDLHLPALKAAPD